MNQSAQSPKRFLKNRSLERKRQLLKVACQAFARRGFVGTHIREICKLSRVYIASVGYHFHDKRGLYEAVKAEAREQLSRNSNCNLAAAGAIAPERQVQAIIESLPARLTGDSEWIARLAAWELVDEANVAEVTVSEGFRGDLNLLELAIKETIGPEADAHAVRLNALDVLGLCVLHCAGKSIRVRLAPNLNEPALIGDGLARHLTALSLRDLGSGVNSSRTRPKAGRMTRPRLPQHALIKLPAALGEGARL